MPWRRSKRDWELWKQKRAPIVFRRVAIGTGLVIALGAFFYWISRENSLSGRTVISVRQYLG